MKYADGGLPNSTASSYMKELHGAKTIGGKMDRLEVIKRIEGVANFWDALLGIAAMDAVKDPDNTKLMETAQILLIKSDERKAMSKKVIGIINECWPMDKTL